MADAYWRLAGAGGLPPAGGLDPRRDFAGYFPYETPQPAGHDIPGYLPRETSQPAVRDLPGYLPRESSHSTGRDLPSYLPRESSQPAVRDLPGYLPRENLQSAGHDLPGYVPRENSQFDDRIGHSAWRTHDPLGHPPEFLRDGVSPYRAAGLNANEIGGSAVGLGGVTGSLGLGSGSGISLGGVPGAAASARMMASPLEDPVLMAQRQGGVSVDPAHAGRTASSEYYAARQDASLRLLDAARQDASLRLLDTARPDASSRLPENLRPDATTNTIFVEGLPPDCTRREVAHIFRPFIGFKQIRVIHKEPRRAGGEPYVLCFVEFADEKCAATALKALQGYKFDDVDHESNPLKLQFAYFPGTRPSAAPVLNDLPRGAS
ncbi:RNA-binding protein 1 [Cryptomeria japonica]|uniref:RNA-binding protein 1 n=1 Tax=Cryptomeria japonica TaxID=3369 RepID=UPI0027DA9B46|nr:RNA-binding protein 1 [Cryptomeria japonica]